jgi:transposase
MREDIITLSKKELERLPVIHKAMEKRIKQVEAAKMLGITDRQVRRIIIKVRKGGDQAVAHGNRGRESPRKIPEEREKKIISIVEKRYYDFGPTFAAEKLLECEEIKIGREKLRQFMISHHIWHPNTNKAKNIHQWRERKHYLGEMIQMDGSAHAWLEDRGPKMDLMGHVDDATGRVYGHFYEYEGTFSAMDSLRRYMIKYGIPLSMYIDRHSTYKTSRQPNLEEELKGEYAKTQFARVLSELGTKYIPARSPQAKGRVERLFQTFQDRLIKEMRLAKISSMKEANVFLETYLPKYNARFAKKPLKRGDLHRPIPENINLDEIFCIKEYRSISNGYTIQWKNRIFLIKEPSITMRKQRVCVMEHFDGKITLKLKDKYILYTEVTANDLLAIARVQKAAQKLTKKARVYYPAPINHPWRRFVYSKRNLIHV